MSDSNKCIPEEVPSQNSFLAGLFQGLKDIGSSIVTGAVAVGQFVWDFALGALEFLDFWDSE